jgi:hypothetical protein
MAAGWRPVAMKRPNRFVPLPLIVLAACTTALAPSPPGGPHDPGARMRPDLIVAEPQKVAPGDVLALAFPAETTRGIHFVLERQSGDTWAHAFDLVSDGPGPDWPRDWSVAGSEDFFIPDIGVGGSGPDRVLIPDIAQPGTWRICTGNAGDNICTTIEIVAP